MSGVRCELRPPRAGWRVAVTFVVLVSAALLLQLLSTMAGSYTAAMAVKQLEDSAASYAVARNVATADFAAWLTIVATAIIVAIWASYAVDCRQYRHRGPPASEPIDPEGEVS